MTIAIIDTETTGTDKDREVIELAYQAFQFLPHDICTDPSQVPFEFCQRYWPSKPISLGAMAVHHILYSDLENCPPAAQARTDLASNIQWIIGHNVDFDWESLGCPNVGRICTLAMSRTLWPELDSHTLTAMTYHLYGQTAKTRESLRNAHSALHDVHLCGAILRKILEVTDISDIEELWRFSEDARLPKKMAFGKHKGMAIADVPYGYVKWYRSQEDQDPYLLKAFKLAGK